MLKFKDAGGKCFSGKTPADVVRQMKRAAWVTIPKRQYMKDVAQRLVVLGTKGVNTANSEKFLASLVKHGWLRAVRKAR